MAVINEFLLTINHNLQQFRKNKYNTTK